MHCLDDVAKAEAVLRYLRPVAMLFQSGYLTVKDYDSVTESFTLGVPDEEVRRDLSTLMTGVAANETIAWSPEIEPVRSAGGGLTENS